MRCSFPVTIQAPEGPFMSVPCGRCMACRINKTSEWVARLRMELMDYDHAAYITLTYSDEYLPENGSLDPDALCKFWKRLRKAYPDVKIKYFACGEYGPETFRPHYHAVVFGVDFAPWTVLRYQEGKPVFTSSRLSDLWSFGDCTVDDVNDTSMSYVAGYVRKKLYGYEGNKFYKDLGVIPPFQRSSQHLGERFALEHAADLRGSMFVYVNGKKRPIPRYLIRKIGLDVPVAPDLPSPIAQKAIEEHEKRLQEFDKFQRSRTTEHYVYYGDYNRLALAQQELELRKKQQQFAARDKL